MVPMIKDSESSVFTVKDSLITVQISLIDSPVLNAENIIVGSVFIEQLGLEPQFKENSLPKSIQTCYRIIDATKIEEWKLGLESLGLFQAFKAKQTTLLRLKNQREKIVLPEESKKTKSPIKSIIKDQSEKILPPEESTVEESQKTKSQIKRIKKKDIEEKFDLQLQEIRKTIPKNLSKEHVELLTTFLDLLSPKPLGEGQSRAATLKSAWIAFQKNMET